jgi:hypothetical protein
MTLEARNISTTTGTFVSVTPILTSLMLAVVGALLVQYVCGIEHYNSDAIFSGVFDLLSIFTGFLATFYVFVVTKGNTFLERIKRTASYRLVLTLLRFTIVWSVLIIVYSYSLMVISPKNYELLSPMGIAVGFWLFNVSLIAVNFVRCVGHFSTIVSTEG